MRRVLELFSGTGSVGKVAAKMGYEVTSLDNVFQATHRCDIMTFKYKMYPPGYFHIVWASPPCTEFSFAKTIGQRDLKGALRIVKRALDIIAYLRPTWYALENPVGYLRHMPLMKNRLDRKTVSYCKYGVGYRKNTDIWTNSKFVPKKCEGSTLCATKRQSGAHAYTVQSGRPSNNTTQMSTTSLKARYTIPPRLIVAIFDGFRE